MEYNFPYKKCVIKIYEEFKFNDIEIACMRVQVIIIVLLFQQYRENYYM